MFVYFIDKLLIFNFTLNNKLRIFWFNYQRGTTQFIGYVFIFGAIGFFSIPIYMDLTLEVQKTADRTNGYRYGGEVISKIAAENNIKIEKDNLKPLPVKENVLVIPKIQVDAGIFEGDADETLHLGIWRRPNGSTPLSGGNTILTAHRMTFINGPNTFYHLDKLAAGDDVFVIWEEREFHYSVTETKIVEDTATYIENPSDESKLTLYTCHPLNSSANRLVVVAELVN